MSKESRLWSAAVVFMTVFLCGCASKHVYVYGNVIDVPELGKQYLVEIRDDGKGRIRPWPVWDWEKTEEILK